ncbi:flagellar motor switch protein FliN [bacterium DOLZORAL124_64_63]|nr:MAG: flagellar motor switch protein FliN [bacterium DOLZORAL124_64_63]
MTDEIKMNATGGTLATADNPVGDEESASLLSDLGEQVPDTANLDLLLDVGLQITVELGRTRLKFRDVLNLSNGSVVELSRQVSEPVDILVNGALLASGEVVVVDDHFAVRITKLLNRVERLKRVL